MRQFGVLFLPGKPLLIIAGRSCDYARVQHAMSTVPCYWFPLHRPSRVDAALFCAVHVLKSRSAGLTDQRALSEWGGPCFTINHTYPYIVSS